MSTPRKNGTLTAYFAGLSKAQWGWLLGCAAICAAIVAVGWISSPKGDRPLPHLTTAMSIREIAPQLGVTGKSLAREFGLPLDVPKGKPLKGLGVDQGTLDHVATHLLSHETGPMKYYVFAALVLWGLVFLTRLGRPDGSPVAERRNWYPRALYVGALLVAVAVCGFALGKSPNPMEGTVKVFKSMVGLYPSVWEKVAAFGFFIVLAVVGNKLVCGWACPFGALQELLYSLPFFKRIKRRKVPFLVSNTIRVTLFVVVLLLLFGVVGGRKGFVVYHFLNPFNLFNFDFDELPVVISIVAAIGLAFLVYRPFCQFICPFGLISWLAERLSLTRVRVDANRCNECGACIQACPLEAAKHKVAGKLFGADCYSCARCLDTCPQDAISYRNVFTNLSRGQKKEGSAMRSVASSLLATVLFFTASAGAADFRNVECEGAYRHHLQGVCVDDEAIYWCFTTQLVKTDLAGKALKQAPVANHHGDLCHHDGKIYVAVNLGRFNHPEGKADSWVYVYDAKTLEELARHETQEVFHGAGGIGFRDDRFFVVGGLPNGVQENYVYEYNSDDFRFLKKHTIPSGHTLLGIQTATFANGRWWFGCYGSPAVLLVTDGDFAMTGRYEFNCSLGIVGLPGGRLLSARGGRDNDKGCTGSVQLVVPDEESGLRYVANE